MLAWSLITFLDSDKLVVEYTDLRWLLELGIAGRWLIVMIIKMLSIRVDVRVVT